MGNLHATNCTTFLPRLVSMVEQSLSSRIYRCSSRRIFISTLRWRRTGSPRKRSSADKSPSKTKSYLFIAWVVLPRVLEQCEGPSKCARMTIFWHPILLSKQLVKRQVKCSSFFQSHSVHHNLKYEQKWLVHLLRRKHGRLQHVTHHHLERWLLMLNT